MKARDFRCRSRPIFGQRFEELVSQAAPAVNAEAGERIGEDQLKPECEDRRKQEWLPSS